MPVDLTTGQRECTQNDCTGGARSFLAEHWDWLQMQVGAKDSRHSCSRGAKTGSQQSASLVIGDSLGWAWLHE